MATPPLPAPLPRRALLRAGVASALAAPFAACRQPPLPPATPRGEWLERALASSEGAPNGQHARIWKPEGWGANKPALVALHGRGETRKSLAGGAAAWRDDYGIDLVLDALATRPLPRGDVTRFVTEARRRSLDASFAATAFEGLALVCPYTPDLPARTPSDARAFASFVVDALVPAASSTLGGALGPLGIDGVSLGGRLALLVGLARPEAFASVGALQPAIRDEDAKPLAELAAAARAKHPKLALRLVSSTGDPFLGPVRALSSALSERGVAHDLVVTDGPHDYAWNRAAGGLELLAYHERVLRGLPPP
jgi:hypothetical protein